MEKDILNHVIPTRRIKKYTEQFEAKSYNYLDRGGTGIAGNDSVLLLGGTTLGLGLLNAAGGHFGICCKVKTWINKRQIFFLSYIKVLFKSLIGLINHSNILTKHLIKNTALDTKHKTIKQNSRKNLVLAEN